MHFFQGKLNINLEDTEIKQLKFTQVTLKLHSQNYGLKFKIT